jgi:response regulator RpfG family c-di-GMP phosphodiesterase
MNDYRCVLIDDDLDDQEIFCLALNNINGFAVTCFCYTHCIEAIEKLSDPGFPSPHIVFVDMNMPLMDGVECITELKKMEHLKNVPLILYSTFADPSKIELVKVIGATEFIEKPTDIDLLTERLSLIFKQYRLNLSQ